MQSSYVDEKTAILWNLCKMSCSASLNVFFKYLTKNIKRCCYCSRNFFDEICPEYTHLLMKYNWNRDTNLPKITHVNKSTFLTEIHNVKCLNIFSIRKYSQLFAKQRYQLRNESNTIKLFWEMFLSRRILIFEFFFPKSYQSLPFVISNQYNGFLFISKCTLKQKTQKIHSKPRNNANR